MMNLVFIPLIFFGVVGGAILSLILLFFMPGGLWVLIPPLVFTLLLIGLFAGALR
jgi:hypothetical protein